MNTPAATVSYAALPSIVFQCGGCRQIVGDTTELACTVTAGPLRLVVLRAATGVGVDKVGMLATEAAGPAGRYFSVCCNGCGSALGRLYTEAGGQELQVLVNCFALDASKCTSYELGSADVRVASQAGGPTNAGAATPGGAQAPAGAAAPAAGANQAAVAELAARVELLQAELTKIQMVMMLHDEQLQQLPGYHEQQQAQQHEPLSAAVPATAFQQAGGGALGPGLEYTARLHTSLGPA